MSQLMQLQIENERTFLTYKYKKVQDIDDVILQLLNEADIEGFAESHMNKAKSTVNYDVTGYRKWSEFSSDELTPEVMASAMENLYHLLAYLEDSFIDIEYVLLDKEYIYVNPGNGKLVILVVPCQAVVDEEYTLTDCVRQMFEQFTYGEGACAKQLESCLQQEIHALETLKELADLLRAYDAEPEEPGETVSDEPAVPEETVILEAIEEEADQIKTESANIAADAEYMRSQLREDMRRELEKELREQIREETRRELETELRESIRAELEEEQAQAETADEKMLDPPAFAKHRAALRNALKGYTRLNVKGLQRIKKGGILFTFSCSQVVTKDQFRNAVFTAAAQAGRKVRILHQLHQPADHPINIYHPEGEYLKGLVLYVE